MGTQSYLTDFSFQSLNSVRRVKSVGKPETLLLGGEIDAFRKSFSLLPLLMQPGGSSGN